MYQFCLKHRNGLFIQLLSPKSKFLCSSGKALCPPVTKVGGKTDLHQVFHSSITNGLKPDLLQTKQNKKQKTLQVQHLSKNQHPRIQQNLPKPPWIIYTLHHTPFPILDPNHQGPGAGPALQLMAIASMTPQAAVDLGVQRVTRGSR